MGFTSGYLILGRLVIAVSAGLQRTYNEGQDYKKNVFNDFRVRLKFINTKYINSVMC